MTDEKKEPVKASSSKDVEENKIIAAIGYLGILFLVPLLAKKDSPFAQFHAKQGLILFIASIAVGIASVIPFIGWFLLAPLGGLFTLVLLIIGIVNVFGGKMQPLPVIGQYADKIKI